jgi:hypothetical protein
MELEIMVNGILTIAAVIAFTKFFLPQNQG